MMPASVHSLWRRQQVEPEGYRCGKSCHRAPVFSTQMMPSRQARGLIGGRPPARDFRGLGKTSLMRFHWELLMNGFGAVLDPVSFGRRRGGHIDREMTM